MGPEDFLRNLAGSAEGAYTTAHNTAAFPLAVAGGALSSALRGKKFDEETARLYRDMSYEPKLPETRNQLETLGRTMEDLKIPPWPITGRLPRVGSGGLAGAEQAAEHAAGPFMPPDAAIARAVPKGKGIAEILRSKEAPGIPVSSENGPIIPRPADPHIPVEQKALPRLTDTGRVPELNERSQALLRSKGAANAVDRQISQGKDIAHAYDTDLENYYGHQGLYDFARNEGLTPAEFDRMLAHFSGASQRNRVPQENRMGSLLWGMDRQGLLKPGTQLMTNKIAETVPRGTKGYIELPKDYGSLAQTDIFDRSVLLANGATPEEIFGPKMLSYHENKRGNQVPITVDVNAMHGPAMQARLSAWLKSSLDKKAREKEGGIQRPRDEYASGDLTMKEALKRPGIWEDAPASMGEYAAWEKLHARGAERAGVKNAGGQALGWFGSGDVTDLKTPPGTAIELMENGARVAAAREGITPVEAMRRMVQGKKGGQLGFSTPGTLVGVAGAGLGGYALSKALRNKKSQDDVVTIVKKPKPVEQTSEEEQPNAPTMLLNRKIEKAETGE